MFFLAHSFCLSCQRGKKVPVKMANLEEKKDEHREQFEYWLSIHAKSDRSSVISTTEYDAIKRYLLNGNQSESKVDRNVKRRVERNNFKLVDLVGLGLDAVVCKAPSAGSENEEVICCS